jgi:predicted phosphoribosyltransferase
MRASIELCKHRAAGNLVVGVPVAGQRTVEEIAALVDDIVVLVVPPMFRAVAQVYRAWRDIPDSEVLAIMARWRRHQQEQNSAR